MLPLDLYADEALLKHERIAFTPGVHTESIIMSSDDWRRLTRPEIFVFSGLPVATEGGEESRTERAL